MKICFFFLLAFAILPCEVKAQDEILLTIDSIPVYRSEFERIYQKNNNLQGYDNKKPAEYLDMFVNFKLKVLEAKNAGYDTLPAFVNELAGYREQLSKPYLQDRTLIDELISEAYYRTTHEINASHIMIKLSADASAADTLAAYKKALDVRNRLEKGESFESLANEISADQRADGGRLGWFSAFTMVYPFENAAYHTPVDSLSMPVRTRYGYHIIRTNAIRPALGEVKLAHIMVHASINGPAETITSKKLKIDSCYQQLTHGRSFQKMILTYSEDAGAAKNMGQMRWLRSGELPASIEEKVFALTDSGSFTVPVQSEYGWHIFQLQGRRSIGSLDQMKSKLEERIMMDERGERIKNAFIKKLKSEYQYTEYPGAISEIIALMDSSVYNGKWQVKSGAVLNKPVCSFNGQQMMQGELITFVQKSKNYKEGSPFSAILRNKLDEMVQAALIKSENSRLEERYPAFANLMQEYHDGILLFNIMEEKVWNKSTLDSTGLRGYFMNHESDYRWKERADISIYTIHNPALLKKAIKLAKKRSKSGWNAETCSKMLCPDDSGTCVEITDQLIEKDQQMPMAPVSWEKGFTRTLTEGNTIKILVINDILLPSNQNFNEIRGQVIADYQNFLDKEWIDALRKKYSVGVNYQVLEQIKP